MARSEPSLSSISPGSERSWGVAPAIGPGDDMVSQSNSLRNDVGYSSPPSKNASSMHKSPGSTLELMVQARMQHVMHNMERLERMKRLEAQDTLESKQELTLVRRLFDESERAILSVTQAFAGLAGRETSLLPSRPQSNSASSRPLPAPAGALARPHELSIHLPTSGLAEDDPPPHARAPRARAPDAGSRQTGRSPRRSVDEQVLKRGAAFPAVGAAFPAVPCDVAPATWRVVSLAELLGRTSDSAAAGGLLAGDSTAPHGYVGPGDGPGGWSVEAEKVGHAGTDGSVPQRAVVLADLISEAVLGASAHAGEREEREGASAHAGGGEREERRGGTAHGRPLQDVHFDRELGRRHREEPHIGGFGPDTPNAQADDRAPSLANDDRAWPGRRGFHGGENEDDHSEESALEDEIAFLDRALASRRQRFPEEMGMLNTAIGAR